MKKKLLSIALAACLTFGGISLFAGCAPDDSSETPPPSTAKEYAEWLIDKMQSTYEVSAWLQYDQDNNFSYTQEELRELSTNASGYVKKEGNKTVSSVQMITRDYNLDRQNTVVSDTKVEFTKNGEDYSMRVFNDSTRIAKVVSLSEQEYLVETCNMLLPGELLSLFVQEHADIELHPNQAPKKYYESGWLPSEEELKNYTVLTYNGYVSYESTTEYKYVVLEVEVYKNELQGISYQESGYSNGNYYIHSGYVGYHTDNVREPFSKDGYYASEAELATVLLSGVFDNLPSSYQATENQKVTIGSFTAPSSNRYIAYEKTGDTEYYYTKSGANESWEIAESYIKNWNGHIGRVYNNVDKTYNEVTCEETLCQYTSEDFEVQHVYINVYNTSFASMAQLLQAVEYAEVELDNDIWTVTFTLPDSPDGMQIKISFVIEGNVLKKTIVESTIDSMPPESGFDGSTAVTTTTTTYTYNTDKINADLSEYTKEQ